MLPPTIARKPLNHSASPPGRRRCASVSRELDLAVQWARGQLRAAIETVAKDR
jgi:hypothetical protein